MSYGNLQNDRSQRKALEDLLAGTVPLPAGALGPGSVARSVVAELRDLGVPVTRFGAIAGGSAATNNVAFQAAADEGIAILVPPGEFALSGVINVTEPNTAFIGAHCRHSRIVTSHPFVFRLREGANNFAAFDLGLETTNADAGPFFYGLIHVNNESVDGITISRCYFTAPGADTNAFGLYADKVDGTNLIRNIWFTDNIIENMAGGGVCFQNHLWAIPDWRIENFWIERNLFKSFGLVNSDFGMGVTITGRNRNGWVRSNILDDITSIGLEMASGNYNVHFLNNHFRNLTRRGADLASTNPIACSTNQSPPITHKACSIIGNQSEYGQTIEGGLFFGDMDDCIVSDNHFALKDSVTIRNCNRMTGGRNKFKCQGAEALVIESTGSGTCKHNLLRETVVDMTDRGSVATAVLAFKGASASTDDNRLIGGTLIRPAASGAYVTTNDSTTSRNVVEQMSTDHPTGTPENWAPRLKTISMSDADLTVNLVDAQYEVIRLTGTLTATRGVRFPREGVYTIYNNTTGGQSISVAPSGGTGATVTNGSKKFIAIRTGDAVDMTPA